MAKKTLRLDFKRQQGAAVSGPGPSVEPRVRDSVNTSALRTAVTLLDQANTQDVHRPGHYRALSLHCSCGAHSTPERPRGYHPQLTDKETEAQRNALAMTGVTTLSNVPNVG